MLENFNKSMFCSFKMKIFQINLIYYINFKHNILFEQLKFQETSKICWTILTKKF